MLKVIPYFSSQQLHIPVLTWICEVTSVEEQVIGSCGDLFGCVGESSGIGEIDNYFDLVDDRFERLVYVIHGDHVGGVIL